MPHDPAPGPPSVDDISAGDRTSSSSSVTRARLLDRDRAKSSIEPSILVSLRVRILGVRSGPGGRRVFSIESSCPVPVDPVRLLLLKMPPMKCLNELLDLLRCGALMASTAEMSDAGVVGPEETATLSTRGEATCGDVMGAMATPLEWGDDLKEDAPRERAEPMRLRRLAGDCSVDEIGRG